MTGRPDSTSCLCRAMTPTPTPITPQPIATRRPTRRAALREPARCLRLQTTTRRPIRLLHDTRRRRPRPTRRSRSRSSRSRRLILHLLLLLSLSLSLSLIRPPLLRRPPPAPTAESGPPQTLTQTRPTQGRPPKSQSHSPTASCCASPTVCPPRWISTPTMSLPQGQRRAQPARASWRLPRPSPPRHPPPPRPTSGV